MARSVSCILHSRFSIFASILQSLVRATARIVQIGFRRAARLLHRATRVACNLVETAGFVGRLRQCVAPRILQILLDTSPGPLQRAVRCTGYVLGSGFGVTSGFLHCGADIVCDLVQSAWLVRRILLSASR